MITPKSVSNQIPDLTKSMRFWGRAVWVSAIAVVIPPLLGTLPTVIGMLRAFEEIGQTGQAGSEVLAEEISFALWATVWGLVISFIALIIFAVALTLFLRRRKALRAIGEENQSDKILA